MKPSLHLKVAVLIGYVALCTAIVLSGQQGEGHTGAVGVRPVAGPG
ncbi:hypothetical protein [Massilia glaciei]|nr:hypothetical protein [Massilia glaciei]